jgi:hypothetical protein
VEAKANYHMAQRGSKHSLPFNLTCGLSLFFYDVDYEKSFFDVFSRVVCGLPVVLDETRQQLFGGGFFAVYL